MLDAASISRKSTLLPAVISVVLEHLLHGFDCFRAAEVGDGGGGRFYSVRWIAVGFIVGKGDFLAIRFAPLLQIR